MRFITGLVVVLGMGFSAQALEVDPSASEFKWSGKKVTGGHYGKLPLKSSKVNHNKGAIQGGEFVLDISKMTVEDLSGSMQTKFLDHMKSEDFFEVAKWPTARLVINKLDGKMAHGQLTIKDKSHPVKFPYTKANDTYSGTLKFDRTKFGMIYGSGDFFKNLGDKMIYNEVTLDFKVKVKAPADKKLSMQSSN
jgi:polyisoprenoid-binding protein YceI